MNNSQTTDLLILKIMVRMMMIMVMTIMIVLMVVSGMRLPFSKKGREGERETGCGSSHAETLRADSELLNCCKYGFISRQGKIYISIK